VRPIGETETREGARAPLLDKLQLKATTDLVEEYAVSDQHSLASDISRWFCSRFQRAVRRRACSS
jgi:hypothetical protein